MMPMVKGGKEGDREGGEGPELITVRAKGSREERALTNQDLEHLACPFEIVPGAVAADLAADLAKMLMREAKASWKPSVWTVFNNTGGTNRLSATYRFDEGIVTRERERRDAVDEDANKDADPTHVTPESTLRRLEESSEAMQNLVRERFAARCERGLARSHKGDDAYVAAWKPSFALCNYYRDGTDGIAFHSDYLTTLGPRAIVAALSLGSTRYFRWHKIESDTKQISEVYTARVPHNHAIIMWPGAQESWKHGVPTQSHESIGAHPLTQLARISLTFRMRRPMIASQAPKCTCGRSAALKYSMRLIIEDDSDGVAAWVAGYVLKRITDFAPTAERPFVLGLPTGSSPLGTYKKLVEFHEAGKLSFANVVTFNMDEYVGIPEDHPESYHSFMWKHLFSKIDIKRENVHLLDGNAKDLAKECEDYEAKIESFGGIELFLGGIGPDGHIAFNEPGSSLASKTRIKTLAYDTIVANSRFFGGDLEKVPRMALTVGVGTVMAAREVLIIILGISKSIALAKCIEEGISHMWTVSAIQQHPCACIVCDEDATMELRVKTVKYFKGLQQTDRELKSASSTNV
ncbi:Glucosamine-6-phosphate isomerase [Hondaea fermentalgiana]|uniref:Glucosamine-6-phosphate deaminase n=1 Tax=Hondaea fermentalgiana TaxID=2315210 RepID=A0A2R5GRP3_9STRA|nr:Glucosamine-6-phosphate isomerase [Hondaea fermentalgiana]|eukprot:GBG32979.1 Glucosamine-6-phosphate isomerase [Hondaea fermentalgiana]